MVYNNDNEQTPYGLDPLTLEKLRAQGIDPQTYIESFGPGPATTVNSINPTDPSNVAEQVKPAQVAGAAAVADATKPAATVGAAAAAAAAAAAQQSQQPPGVDERVSNDPNKPTPVTEVKPIGAKEYMTGLLGGLDFKKEIHKKEAKNQSEGYLTQAEIETRAAEADRQALAQQQYLNQQYQQDQQVRQDKLMAQIDKEHAEVQDKVREQYNKKIDPERYWNSKSTGAKILAGIGMVLGGMGGGMTKTGRNPALEQINKAINDDIDAQKYEIDNNFKAISGLMSENKANREFKKDLINDMYNKDMHRLDWENKFRLAGLETVKIDLAAAANKTNSETVKNNALMAINEIEQKQNEIKYGWGQQIAAQQAAWAAAQQARIDKQGKEIIERVDALVKNEGVDPDQALDYVVRTGGKRYAEYIQSGRAPTSVYQNMALRKQVLEKDLPQLIGKKVSEGMTAEDAEKAAKAEILTTYPTLFGGYKGPVVPGKLPGGAAAAKDIGEIDGTLKAIDESLKDLDKGGVLHGITPAGSLSLSAKRSGPGTLIRAGAEFFGVAPDITLDPKKAEADQRTDFLLNEYIKKTTGAQLGKEGTWEGGNAAEANRLYRTFKGDGSEAGRREGLRLLRNRVQTERDAMTGKKTPVTSGVASSTTSTGAGGSSGSPTNSGQGGAPGSSSAGGSLPSFDPANHPTYKSSGKGQ